MQLWQKSLLVALSILLVGCGIPTKEEWEARQAKKKAYQAKEAARLAKAKAEFEADVATKTEAAKGKTPVRVKDPGYPVANCISPTVGPGDSALQVMPISKWTVIRGVICENTEAGQKVLAWREWYCRSIETDTKNVRKCVISWWRDGLKFPGKHFEIVTNRNVQRPSRTSKIIFGPATWKAGE